MCGTMPYNLRAESGTTAVRRCCRLETHPERVRRRHARRSVCRRLQACNTAKPSMPSPVRRRQGPAVPQVVADTQKGAVTPRPSATARPQVVILGSGWGSISFIKALPKDIANKYDITLLSPRNYFLFTALLPAAAFGNVETRSIIEANRKLIQGKGRYFEAACTSIDPKTKVLGACFPKHAGLASHCFTIQYDILIAAVGSINNTFGIKGVKEHAYFFKSIEDAVALRQRVCECFERAALPDTTDEEAREMLTFVIVGGGPTGVEVAAELHDLLDVDLRKFYPYLVKHCSRVLLVELGDHVLSTYDRTISEYTSALFQREGIDLVLNSRVSAIEHRRLTLTDSNGQTQQIPFGACCWATGVAIHPLVKHLQEQLPSQDHFRSIVTDDHLRVLGGNGSIWALGDAATVDQPRALEHAEELFEQADRDSDGNLTLSELQEVMKAASERYYHLAEHARFLEGKVGHKRWGGLVQKKIQPANGSHELLGSLDESSKVTREQFVDILTSVDNGLRALPATGQVASQQGAYLARLFAKNDVRPDLDLEAAPPFRYSHPGSVAYVGADRAVFDLPRFGPLKALYKHAKDWVTGSARCSNSMCSSCLGAGVLWRGFETYRQISFRNQCLVVGDFIKTRVFGRDVEFGLAEDEPNLGVPVDR